MPTNQDALRYPVTFHVAGSNVEPGDVVIDFPALDSTLAEVFVEEKVDGVNVGLTLDSTGDLMSILKYGDVSVRQFSELEAWLAENGEGLKWMLAANGPGAVAYGEYLSPQGRKPGIAPWLMFDLWTERGFARRRVVANQAWAAGVVSVPLLYQTRLPPIPDFAALVGESHVRTGPMEGVVIRVESPQEAKRLKYVRAGFQKRDWFDLPD